MYRVIQKNLLTLEYLNIDVVFLRLGRDIYSTAYILSGCEVILVISHQW